ncbi:helix-turn-helix transcriptional regulator [Desulfogranum mediterraneum]|uniref:helix-turn-helix transcriptional regulator n=1 Tax=Desulfogranum mediterraneum TaxID=160661 RepID=UPI000490A10D|nr:helix-turn-helix transcriptional regulator [Desulfogranum mediterraneum]
MVANETAMGKYHFCRRFKQYFGLSFKPYPNRKRITVANRLLAEHGYSVSDACFSGGFNDASYLSKVFEEVKGKPAKHYLYSR